MEDQQITEARLGEQKNTRADELIIAAFSENGPYRNLDLYFELLNNTKVDVSIQKKKNPKLWELFSCLIESNQDKELQQLIRQKIIHLTLMGLRENEIPCTQEVVKEKLSATMKLVPFYEHKIFLQYRMELDLAIQEGATKKRLPLQTKLARSLDNLIALTNLLTKYGAEKLEVNDTKYSLLRSGDRLKNYIISLPSAVTKLDLGISTNWAHNEIIDSFSEISADILQKINLFLGTNDLSKKASLMGEMQQIFLAYLKKSDIMGAKSVIKILKLFDEEEIAQSLQQKLDDISKGNWRDKATHPIITPEPESSSNSKMIFREWR